MRLSEFIGDTFSHFLLTPGINAIDWNSGRKLLNLLFLSSFTLVSFTNALISNVKYLYDETP